jgi:uncharacterized protein (TIGR03067 family)
VDTSLLDPAAVREQAVQAERDRLQGSWTYVSGLRAAQLLFVGSHYTVKFDNGDIYLGTYVLHPDRKPKVMEMRITEGPERHRGKKTIAIYEMDGPHLIWCSCEPGKEESLTAFPPEDDRQHLCIIFRREKPQRRTEIRLATR